MEKLTQRIMGDLLQASKASQDQDDANFLFDADEPVVAKDALAVAKDAPAVVKDAKDAVAVVKGEPAVAKGGPAMVKGEPAPEYQCRTEGADAYHCECIALIFGVCGSD